MNVWYEVVWHGKEGIIQKGVKWPNLFGALGEAADPQRNTQEVIRIEIRKLRHDKELDRFFPIGE